MDALQQRVEIEPAVLAHDDDFTVDDAAARQVRAERLDELGEVARHRPLVAAAEDDLVSVAVDDGAESVPFRLVEHLAFLREPSHQTGEHGRHRRHDGQFHEGKLGPARTAINPEHGRPRRRGLLARRPVLRRGREGTGADEGLSIRIRELAVRQYWTVVV